MFKRSVLETVEVATAGCELEAMFHVEHSATSEWEDILFDCRRSRAFENSPIRQLNVDGTIDVCLESAYSILFSWMVHPSVLRRKFYTECFTWNSDRLRSDRPTNSMARSDHESPRLFQSILQSPLIHIAQINRGPHTNVPRGTFRRRLGSTLEAAVKRKSHVGATQIPRAPTNFEQRWNGPTRSTIR